MAGELRLWSTDCAVYRPAEAIALDIAEPAVLQNRKVSSPRKACKSFNMSGEYASDSGSGAREHVQNWFDQCRSAVDTRQPKLITFEGAALASVTEQVGVLPGLKLYVAVSPATNTLFGIILAGSSSDGFPFVMLKNYGAQMTLDDLILGQSSKRQDAALAGMWHLLGYALQKS